MSPRKPKREDAELLAELGAALQAEEDRKALEAREREAKEAVKKANAAKKRGGEK